MFDKSQHIHKYKIAWVHYLILLSCGLFRAPACSWWACVCVCLCVMYGVCGVFYNCVCHFRFIVTQNTVVLPAICWCCCFRISLHTNHRRVRWQQFSPNLYYNLLLFRRFVTYILFHLNYTTNQNFISIVHS